MAPSTRRCRTCCWPRAPPQARGARLDGLHALGIAPAERLRDQDREPIPLRLEDAVAVRVGEPLAVGGELDDLRRLTWSVRGGIGGQRWDRDDAVGAHAGS